MRIAAAQYLSDGQDARTHMARWLRGAIRMECDLLLAPGLYGWIWDGDTPFLEAMKQLSSQTNLLICPGSYPEQVGGRLYHSSCLLHWGKQVLVQRQLFLSPIEKDLGIQRGDELKFAQYKGVLLSLLLPTDAYHPEVARAMALEGAQLALCPTALPANAQGLLQTLWSAVQQNSLYALCASFVGRWSGRDWSSETALLAPLELTERKDGFLTRKEPNETLLIDDLTQTDLANLRRVRRPIQPAIAAAALSQRGTN